MVVPRPRPVHRKAGAYLDGALAEADERRFLDHLAGCARCRDDLRADVELRDREDRLRADAALRARRASERIDALPIAIARPPRTRRWPLIAGGAGACALAAAAIAVIAIGQGGAVGAARPPALALADARAIAPRLTWGAAAAHRPYDVARGATGEAPGEPIANAALAALEDAGDCHGLATAYLLAGEHARAARAFDGCGDGAELDSDRAALALLRGAPEDALELADRALARAPALAAARWNRALALDALGLGLTAADELEAVAAAGDDWAGEARDRAAAVRAPLAAMAASYARAIEAGSAMVAGGPPIELELARRHPWRARTSLSHAMRAATTAARLEELRPLARALDGVAGSGLLADLDRAIARLTPGRARLAAGYARWAKELRKSDAAAVDRWLAEARAARQDDLIAATLVVTGRAETDAAALALAGDDRWLRSQVMIDRASAAHTAGRVDEALRGLDEVDGYCRAHGLPYRCLQADLLRAFVETTRYRPPEVKRLALAADVDARRTGEWVQHGIALLRVADAERFRNRVAVAVAYYREYARVAGNCRARANAAASIAELRFDQRRFADAAAELRTVDDCAAEARPTLAALGTEVSLTRAGHPRRATAAILADLAGWRGSLAADDPRQLEIRKYELELRADDGDAGPALDAFIADLERGGTGGHRFVGPARATRLVALGRRGDLAAVVARAAADAGVPAPARCALVLASDDFRFVGVAIDPGGALHGLTRDDLPWPASPAAGWEAPAALRAPLAGCETVDVLATVPWFGTGPLLDAGLAWRFVVGATATASSSAAAGGAHVVIAEPRPPAELGLAPLAPLAGLPSAATVLRGADATPEAARAAMAGASLIELHAHAVTSATSDTPVLALTAGAGGWELTAEQIRELHLAAAPVVLLADCSGGLRADYEHVGWGLPPAFRAAGARAVVASLAPIPDREGAEVFAALRAAVQAGAPAAVAVARVRAAKIAADPTSWVRHLVVFE